MGAYQQIARMYREGILAKAVELGYSQANLCILKGDLERLKNDFPECFRNLQSCLHNKDSRSLIEYARDLVASWIFEDTIVQKLVAAGLSTSLAGADQNREILATTKVSASSDCTIAFNGKHRHLEIMSDYTGWWESTGHMELRDAKYIKLSREKALFLGICTVSQKYILLDFAGQISARYISAHRPYGGKPAYSISLERAALKKFLMPPLVEELKMVLSVV